ncbi:MAG: antibiotic biosynthesis monooxygenase [Chloroflexi bacterium]|nr:antibiotic biosynthesis monooxygenase [Chloroflexota bacterium]
MPTKILIERKIKPGSLGKLLELSMKLRAEAVRQPGYICGETLVSAEHDDEYLVISTWRHLEDWIAWLNNPNRAAIAKEMEKLLVEPPKSKAYVDLWSTGAP